MIPRKLKPTPMTDPGSREVYRRWLAWHRKIHRMNLKPIKDFWTCPRTTCRQARALIETIEAKAAALRDYA